MIGNDNLASLHGICYKIVTLLKTSQIIIENKRLHIKFVSIFICRAKIIYYDPWNV